MALKQHDPVKEKVGDQNFYIRPFPAFKAANLTGELASVLAPLLGALAPLVGGKGADGGEKNDLFDIDVQDAGNALANCKVIDGDQLEKLMQKLLLGGHIATEVEGEPTTLDEDVVNEIFCGEVQDMFILCFHVIKLNFNGFFKKIVGLFGTQEAAPDEKTGRPIL